VIYLHVFLKTVSVMLGILFPLVCFLVLASFIIRKRTDHMIKASTEATNQFLKAKLHTVKGQN